MNLNLNVFLTSVHLAVTIGYLKPGVEASTSIVAIRYLVTVMLGCAVSKKHIPKSKPVYVF